MELKRHQVHMLPTEDKHTSAVMVGVMPDIMRATQDEDVINDIHDWMRFGTPQHLYFTTDEEIKEGDKVLLNSKIYTFDRISGSGADALFVELGVGFHSNKSHTAKAWLSENCRKIIATTNPKLIKSIEGLEDYGLSERIAQIPQDFIKAYCEQGGIDEVDIEYENIVKRVPTGETTFGLGMRIKKDKIVGSKPKLNPDNTVITHLIEEKMYSLDVVRKAYLAGWVRGDLEIPGNPNEWIRENL